MQITPMTAKNNINKMISAGVLRQLPGTYERRKVYVADELLTILEEIY